MRTGILTLMLAAVVAWLGGCGAGAVLRHPFDPEVWSYRSQEDEPITLDVAGPVVVGILGGFVPRGHVEANESVANDLGKPHCR